MVKRLIQELQDNTSKIMKKYFVAISVVIGFVAFIGIAIVTNLFSSADLPVQISGALLEAVITALITYFLLSGQTSQEKERDKDVRIFEEKVTVYSEFSEKLWGMITDDNEVSNEELIELRKLCFSKLVFYLNDAQIKCISDEIRQIDIAAERSIGRIARITQILQENLQNGSNSFINKSQGSLSLRNKTTNNNLIETRQQLLSELFNSFNREEVSLKDELIVIESDNIRPIQYWHFNLLGDEQLKSFENNNWVLALIEYGESWRTNLIKQVKPNDVIFLFRRGGYGYIGAFKALDDPTYKILEFSKIDTYTKDYIDKYDIYNGLNDGATLCSNLLVEPIAFNPLGVGTWSVRRRTIERMNDFEAVKFLLNRLNGKGKDKDGNELSEKHLKSFGKLNIDSKNEIKLDIEYFKQVLKLNKLN
jgi:hypothetical protein